MNKKTSRRNGFRIMMNLVLLLGRFAYFLIFAVFNGVLGYACAMGVTIFGSLAIAKFLGEDILLSYGWLIALTIGCGVLRGALRYVEQYSNHYIAFRLLAILRDRIFAALRKLAPARLEDKKKGDIIAMITSDIETLEVFYAHTLSPILICLFVNLGVLLYVGFLSSWVLSLVALISYLVIGIVIPLVSSRWLKDTGVTYRKEFASFSAYYLDSIKGVKDIVLNQGESLRKKEVDARSDRLLRETKKMKHRTSISSSLVELFVSVTIIVTLSVGLLLVFRGQLSVARMILGVVAVFGSFGPVIAISNLPGNLTQTFASGDRVLNLLQEKPVVEEVTDGSDFRFHELEIRDLSFAYEGEPPVLQNVNLKATKGKIIGLVGPSGCGKSTLLKLLLRFHEKGSGAILYDDKDIDTINTASLLDNVTMVSQTTYLFDDTILENLRIAKPNATMEEVIEACKKASIHDFIMKLPKGYDTRVGSSLENVSAGEKQRLGLARAFLRGSEVILLDEPTSNVDSINEGMILKSLVLQKKDKCILLVSHRESTVAVADEIYRAPTARFPASGTETVF